jgi:hypothetical protein
MAACRFDLCEKLPVAERAEVADFARFLLAKHEAAPAAGKNGVMPARRSLVGFAKGVFEMSADFNKPLEEFSEYR